MSANKTTETTARRVHRKRCGVMRALLRSALRLLRHLIAPSRSIVRYRRHGTPDTVRDHGATIVPGRVIDSTGALSPKEKRPP